MRIIKMKITRTAELFYSSTNKEIWLIKKIKIKSLVSASKIRDKKFVNNHKLKVLRGKQ